MSRGRRRGRCAVAGVGSATGAIGVSALVASNLPSSSEGSSIFSVGRSSMGMKSSSGSDKIGLSSITTFLTTLGASVSKFNSGSAFLGSSFFATGIGAGMGAFSSVLVLRGRPGLRFGVASSAFSGADAVVTTASGAFSATGAFVASATGCTLAVATVVSAFALVRSPFLLAVKTLSVLSFFTVTRVRFCCLSTLRSSFSFSAATFLVAPAMACSSSIL